MKPFILFLVSLSLVLTGCSAPVAKRLVIAPALASVSVPLARAKDAVKVARDRLEAGDLPAAKTAIAMADAKVEESSAALATAETKVEELVGLIGDRDAAIVTLRKENHQIAKERDILPFVSAILCALWILAISDALPVAAQYRIYLKLIAFVLGFGSGYGAGRLLVRALATFIP